MVVCHSSSSPATREAPRAGFGPAGAVDYNRRARGAAWRRAPLAPPRYRSLVRRRGTALNPILLLLGALAFVALGYALARWRAKGSPTPAAAPASTPLPAPVAAPAIPPSGADPAPATAPLPSPDAHHAPELARLVRSLEAESAALRQRLVDREAGLVQAAAFAEDRRRLFAALAQSRAETARYRQLVVDIENNAPPVLFGTAAPDDLKLIVGVGPVLERMLHQLGVTRYRDIARWSERDIDEFDARLAEFPGRIRRDGWVTQARALHQSKYGEAVGGGARR